MSKLETLKSELKSLGSEYAKIKTLRVEERRAFGEKINAKKQKLLQEIAKLEKQARAEKQPKKKFELVQQIKALNEQLKSP